MKASATADEVRRWRLQAERESEARLKAEAAAESATRALHASNAEFEVINQQLAQTEALYRELFVRNPLPLYIVARHGLWFLEVNEAAQAHYGFERDEFLRMTLRDIEPVSTLESADQRRDALNPDQVDAGLWRHVSRSGRVMDVELSMHTVQWAGQPAWLIVAHDVTAHRHAQQILELRNQAMEASQKGMFVCSADAAEGGVCYVNAAMARFSGQDREELIGRSLPDLFPGDWAGDAARLLPGLRAGRRARAMIALRHETRATRWLEVELTPVSAVEGEGGHWVGVVQDITERRTLEAERTCRAGHDDLTGLPNRDALYQQLADAIAAAEQTGHEVAVLFLNLDGFRQINDAGGHRAGDGYLQVMAQRLRARIRDIDMLARVGGDEFVVVATGARLVRTLSRCALRLQDAFNEPVTVGEQSFSARCSIGIACYPTHGTNAETLLRRADLTMCAAKRNGGQAIEWFSETMEQRVRQRGAIEAALQHALAQGEFELHYQPQVDMRRGVVVGLEALLRWPSADAAYRSPADFIPVAEETGLIIPIGAWVLEQACADLAALRAGGHTELTMAVNASAIQLRDPRFAEHVAAVLSTHELPAEVLGIEITESVFMVEHEQSISTLHDLEAIGVRLAIDDFGTGYSSLSYLSRLPIHRLKIDRSFISQMNGSRRASELVRAVARMADNLGLEVLAEGVETEAEERTLLGYDCLLAQGFYYSRGVPVATLAERLDAPTMSVAGIQQTPGSR